MVSKLVLQSTNYEGGRAVGARGNVCAAGGSSLMTDPAHKRRGAALHTKCRYTMSMFFCFFSRVQTS